MEFIFYFLILYKSDYHVFIEILITITNNYLKIYIYPNC